VLAAAAEGANVVIDYVAHPEETTALISKAEAAGGHAVGFQADITQAPDLHTMVQIVVEAYGRLDVLINNAGIETRTSLLDTTEADFDTYDTAGRLHTSATTGATTYTYTYTYTYDPDGNRLTAGDGSTQNLGYNPGNQITTTGYSHDGAGNLTADPSLGTFGYTAAGQLSTFTKSGVSGSYVYAGTDSSELVSQTCGRGPPSNTPTA